MCEEDLRIMHLMDELHMEDPCRGTRRIFDEFLEKGVLIGRDKGRGSMQAMRIKSVYCLPSTTVADATKYKFPYLLRELTIERRNQGMGRGHHLRTRRWGFPPHGGVGDDRSVQPLHPELEHLQQHGGRMGDGHDHRGHHLARKA